MFDVYFKNPVKIKGNTEYSIAFMTDYKLQACTLRGEQGKEVTSDFVYKNIVAIKKSDLISNETNV